MSANFFDQMLAKIRTRTREEWVEFWFEKWRTLRIWIQENGEFAAIAALALGVFVVVAFKLIFYIALIAGCLGFAVWLAALPGDSQGGGKDPYRKDGDSSINGSGNNTPPN